MKHLLAFLFAISTLSTFSQNFAIGTRTIVYNDPARTGGTGSGGGPGRQMQTYLYYPAVSAGANAAVASGSFPVVVFGHGFSMTYEAYKPIYDSLAKWGYVVCMLNTEGGLSPVHTDFGKDMALVLDKTLAFNTDNTSPFFGKLNGKGGIGGHSMGGGASFLSAQYTTNENCIFNFAAAETNPSAVAQCSNAIDQPLLVIAGSYDVVSPPASNQDLMYNTAIAACKSYVNITGGYHCQFSDVNIACQFGEGSLAPPSGGPSRNAQLATTRQVLRPFLDFWLKGICSQWTNFEAILAAGQGITSLQTCNVDIPASASISASGSTTICPNTTVDLTASPAGYVTAWSNNQTSNAIAAGGGSYTVTLTGSNNCSVTSAATQVTVATPVAPTISAQGSLSFCDGGSVTLTSSAATGNIWNDGQNTQSITVSQAGDFTVTANDANDCAATSLATTVTLLPSPNATIVPQGSTSVCSGNTVTLNSPSATGNLWSNGQTTQSITLTQSEDITLTVTGANGCQTTSAVVAVNIGSSLVPPIAGSNGLFICGATPVTLSLSDFANYTTVTWDNNSTSQSITVSAPGNYCASATDNNGCSGNNCISISDGTPSATFTTQGTSPFLLNSAVTFTPTITSGSPNSALLWNYGDGSFGANTSHTYTAIGIVDVCLTVQDDITGCLSDPSCQEIAIDQFIGLAEVEFIDFKLLPNPASETVSVQGNLSTSHPIILSDMLGQVLITKASNQENTVLDLKGLPAGIYIVQIGTQQRKLMVE